MKFSSLMNASTDEEILECSRIMKQIYNGRRRLERYSQNHGIIAEFAVGDRVQWTSKHLPTNESIGTITKISRVKVKVLLDHDHTEWVVPIIMLHKVVS